MEVKQIIAEIKEKMDQRGGLKHMYFVACGGSKAAIFPGLYLIQSEAKNFSATTYTSNEFVHATPKELDERCIAVICSLKATPETVKAVETANAAGAITIAMTGNMQTGMAKVGQYVVTYSNGDHQDYSDSNQAMRSASALRFSISLKTGINMRKQWKRISILMRSFQRERKIVFRLHRHGLKKSNMSRSSMSLHPVRTMELLIPCAAVTLWRCSGNMRYACTQVSTSMDRLRQPIRSFR